MKFQCEQEAFASAVQSAARAVSPRASHPALAGLLVTAAKGRVEIVGTDQVMAIQAECDAMVESEGSALITARLLGEILKSLEPGNVVVESEEDGSRIDMRCERSSFKLRTQASEDFPPQEDEAEESSAELPAGEFAEAVDQVAIAASTDEARMILNGVLISGDGKGLRMVATDSYRLAIRDLEAGGSLAGEGGSLIPARALAEAGRLARNSGGETVKVALGKRQARFEIGETKISTRLIEGDFPEYERLIPETFPNKLSLAKGAFLDSVKRVGTLAQQSNTPLRITCGQSGATISVQEQDVGEAEEEVIDAKYEGDELTIAFNPGYLRDGVNSCPGDWVSIEMLDELKAALIKGRDSDEYRYLLMPIRI